MASVHGVELGHTQGFVLRQLEDPKLCNQMRDSSGSPFVRVADITTCHATWGSLEECIAAGKGQLAEEETQDDGAYDITTNE